MPNIVKQIVEVQDVGEKPIEVSMDATMLDVLELHIHQVGKAFVLSGMEHDGDHTAKLLFVPGRGVMEILPHPEGE